MNKYKYEHTPADDLAAANADVAFEEGKWQQFTGGELIDPPEFIESKVDHKESKTDEGFTYPEFYKHEHEQLTEEQLKESSKIFNTLFDDVMLDGMTEVKRYEIIKDKPTAELLRSIEVKD